MNLRHWRIFLAIAESGSLSRTAEATGIGQPGLSRIVRDLELSFGVNLFERHTRGLRLTPTGEQFRHRAAELLAEIGSLGEELKAKDGELIGTCAIGMPPSLSNVLTVPMLLDFSTAHPGVRLRVWESPAQWVRDAIINRQVDIGVIAYPMAHPTLITSGLATEQIYLIGAPGAALDPLKPVSLEEVSNLPLVISSRSNAVRRLLENAVERSGRQLKLALEFDGAVAEYVRSGFGYSVLPASALRNSYVYKHISRAPIADLTVTWATVRRDEPLTECAQRLLDAITARARKHITAGEWEATLPP